MDGVINMREMIEVFFAKFSTAALKIETNTGAVMDFLSAALPWISIGLLLAIFFAQNARKKKNNKKVENYSTEGMTFGMCFGVAIGTAFGNNTGIGLSLGMLAGLVIGSCIEKKKNTD